MAELQLIPHTESLVIGAEGPALEGTEVSTWQVSQKRGNIAGVGASVSGAGAWVNLSGSMAFKARKLESSRKYQEMKKSYGISGGVSGFWGWLGIGANASTHKSEIQTALNEASSAQEASGNVNINMGVTSPYPGFAVDAAAYVLVLQITNSAGQSFNVASAEAPGADTGAQDQNGNAIPQKDNNSTITL